jgi:hypothetical protein
MQAHPVLLRPAPCDRGTAQGAAQLRLFSYVTPLDRSCHREGEWERLAEHDEAVLQAFRIAAAMMGATGEAVIFAS